MLDAKFFTLLVFIAINFSIIFAVRTRTTTITSIIITHLVMVLFFSLSISNYNSFKEIVLALIAYSMVILFLISNYNITGSDSVALNKVRPRWSILVFSSAMILVSTIFLALLFVTANVTKIAESVRDRKISKQAEVMQNPMILPSHPVHIAVKTYYLGKKFEDDWSDKISASLEINERKRARLKDRLSDNFLLKRSSDMILVIVAVSTALLILSDKNSQGNS